MDINFLRGITTAILFTLFIFLIFRVYSPSQKEALKRASLLPFDNTEQDTGAKESNE